MNSVSNSHNNKKRKTQPQLFPFQGVSEGSLCLRDRLNYYGISRNVGIDFLPLLLILMVTPLLRYDT